MKNLYIFLLLFLMVSCAQKEEVESKDSPKEISDKQAQLVITQQQFQSAGMQLGTISQHDFHNFITTTGRLEAPPQSKADVSAYYGGYVKNINLTEGQWVNAGEVLFTLENPEFIETQQDYLEAKSQLEYLRQDYERQKILAEEQIVSQKKYQRSKADYDLISTQTDILKKKLHMMKINPQRVNSRNLYSSISITAPISGYINTLQTVKGQFLSPQDVALSIVNTNNIDLVLSVFEKELSQIKTNMPVEFRLQENSDSVYIAKIRLINKIIDPVNRTVDVLCDIQSETVNFSSGMFAEAKILTASQTRPALPKEAVLNLDEEKTVLVKVSATNADLTFRQQQVETGLEDEQFIEIFNNADFPEKHEILVKGGFQLVQ